MAPSTVERERGARQQKYNDIGNMGRMTGVKPPTNVPRDSTGNEQPAAYFQDDDDDQDSDATRGQRQQQPPPPPPRSVKRGNHREQSVPTKNNNSPDRVTAAQGPRRVDRPDLYADIGERGRKTGIQVTAGSRDDEGFEGMSAYFNSSPARSSPSGSRSVRKSMSSRKSISTIAHADDEDDVALHSADQDNVRGGQNYDRGSSRDSGNELPPLPDLPVFRREYNENEYDGPTDFGGGEYSDQEIEEEREFDYSDMQVDDGSSMTPTAYQRVHASSKRGPSSLRQSFTASQGQRVTTNGLDADDDSDDEADAEEVRQIMVSASQQKRSARPSGRKSVAAGSRIQELPSDGEVSGQDFDDRQEDEDDVNDDDEEQGSETGARSGKGKGKGRASIASTRSSRRDSGRSPLVKLGRNGQEVATSNVRRQRGSSSSVSPAKRGGKAKGKGVARGSSPVEEEDMPPFEDGDEQENRYSSEEDEQQYDDHGDHGNDEEAEQEQPGRRSKGRNSNAANAVNTKKRAPAAKSSRKRPRADSYEDDQGVRRSARHRLEPLEYWRNERVVYKRRQSGIAIEDVVRIPKERIPMPHDHRKKGGAGTANNRGRSASRDKSEAPQLPEETGVDDATDPDGLVWSWEGDAEVSRRIAFTAKMINPRPTYNNKFAFQKIFTELDYLAGGILQIPAGAEKPTKPAKDNSYMFYCIEGSVSVVVHRTRFAIGPGATFFVPRGNSYSITATSNRDVKLFFTQGRRVIEATDGSTRPDTMEDSRRVSMGPAGVGRGTPQPQQRKQRRRQQVEEKAVADQDQDDEQNREDEEQSGSDEEGRTEAY